MKFGIFAELGGADAYYTRDTSHHTYLYIYYIYIFIYIYYIYENLYTLKLQGVHVLSLVYHTIWQGQMRCDDLSPTNLTF